MKSFAAGLLAAGLLIAFVGGCKEKTEEPVAQAPEQAPPPRSFPEAQVPAAEPQPAPVEPALPVDSSVDAHAGHNHAAEPAPEPMPKENYARPEKKAQTYVVKRGDTLQKISQKFYGTTKNWRKIYQANKKTLKDPDKVAEGDKLIIP